jgi:hypothetical protein
MDKIRIDMLVVVVPKTKNNIKNKNYQMIYLK